MLQWKLTRRKQKKMDITGEKLKGMFNEYHEHVLKAIDEWIDDISIASQVEVTSEETITDIFADNILEESRHNAQQEMQQRLYTYEGKMWHVPKIFRFPENAKLHRG